MPSSTSSYCHHQQHQMMTIVSNLKEAACFIPALRPHARHAVLKHLSSGIIKVNIFHIPFNWHFKIYGERVIMGKSLVGGFKAYISWISWMWLLRQCITFLRMWPRIDTISKVFLATNIVVASSELWNLDIITLFQQCLGFWSETSFRWRKHLNGNDMRRSSIVMLPWSKEALARVGINHLRCLNHFHPFSFNFIHFHPGSVLWSVSDHQRVTMNDDEGCNHLIPPELTRDSLTSSWDSLFLERKSIYSQIYSIYGVKYRATVKDISPVVKRSKPSQTGRVWDSHK